MGTIWVREFTGGLDTRRLPETTSGNVLVVAQDGHINRGGEFEQRAAFVPEHSLPAGTIGLASDRTGPVVFGSDERPAGLPIGVTYQRLMPPNGSRVARILSTDLYAGKLYVAAQTTDGGVIHFYNGEYVRDWYDGRARATFGILSGADGDTIEIKIDGTSVSGTVEWAGTVTATATAIAESISQLSSAPEYTAVADGSRVVILAVEAGSEPNGRTVTFEKSGAFAINPIGVEGDGSLSMQGGASLENTYQPGTYVKTIGSKMYAVSGSKTHFSGIQQPTKWTTDTVGAGFIDMSSELIALAKYRGFVAVFGETAIQIWYLEPDPSLNKQTQVLHNTGTASPLSVTQFGDNDLFYLDETGIRSLRARDSSNAAATADIGVPIDPLVAETLRGLTEEQRQRIRGLIEPQEGRFWLTVGDRIFVFSYFPGAKVSAWSTYSPGFEIEQAVSFNRRIYLRSGDTIYVYGGLGKEPVHDETPAVARLPYFDAGTPTAVKTLTGLDFALKGQWDVTTSFDPTNPDAVERIAIADETTFDLGRIPATGRGTHFGLLLTSRGKGPHRLASAVLHYESGAGPS